MQGPNIYEQVDNLFSQNPSWRVLEAIREAIQSRIDNCTNDKDRKFWELNLQDADRMFKRGERRAGIR